jgi:hypothetical protein
MRATRAGSTRSSIELGILVRDAGLAVSVARHFQVLIDRGLLTPLPEA